MAYCVYCDHDCDKLSDEHIWPDALGGDFLPRDVWRLEVCPGCNSMSGLFVDGGFIKSCLGNAERATGALEYMRRTGPDAGVLPLNYMGPLKDIPVKDGEVAEFWVGPCGANIIHIRPADTETIWASYAGGSPRLRRKKPGRAYMALSSEVPFWIEVSLRSFSAHFEYAYLYLLNMDVPAQWASRISRPDPTDQVAAETTDAVLKAASKGEALRVGVNVSLDVGHRFLAKLGLALGYKLLGQPLLDTAYAKNLRRGFRQPDPSKRATLGVRGTGLLPQGPLAGVSAPLTWRGGWVLLLWPHRDGLSLVVVSPSGKVMSIVVCDQPSLIAGVRARFEGGAIWLTIPTLGQAAGPIPLPEYIAHLLGAMPHAELTRLASLRIDPTKLPACSGTSSSATDGN